LEKCILHQQPRVFYAETFHSRDVLFFDLVFEPRPTGQRDLVGGSVSMDTNGSSGDTSQGLSPSSTRFFSIGIIPQVGLFVSDRWAVGLSASWNYNQERNESSPASSYYTDRRNSRINISLFARYYVPISEKWYAFGNLTGISYGFGRNTIKQASGSGPTTDVTRSSSYNIGAFLGLGATCFFTPKIAIEATIGAIGYGFGRSETRVESDPGSSSQKASTNFNGGNISLSPSSIALGARFYLGKARG
jgi:hypothetical protein